MGTNEWVGRRIIYNGGTGYYNYADDPSVLMPGHVYEVTDVVYPSGSQTNLVLRGFPGKEFNSVWFTPYRYGVNSKVKPEYLAASNSVPVKGKSFKCVMIQTHIEVNTSVVLSVKKHPKCPNVYLAETRNSYYLVLVTYHHLNSYRDEGEIVKPEYLVSTFSVPQVGQNMICYTAQTKDMVTTSVVTMVAEYLDFPGIYFVMTRNSYYIVLQKLDE